MCRAADNGQESPSFCVVISPELDCDGGGAGEGARDGGATKLLSVSSKGHLNPVIATGGVVFNIKT